MFYNTGAVSFWLYVIFLAILFIGMFMIIRFILKSNVDPNKIDKIAELAKYCIVTVGIATVSPIIANFFAERDQDLEELNYLDKYTEVVTKADGEGRYQLARFMAVAAPAGELKDGWKAYYDSIRPEHTQYLQWLKERSALQSLERTPANAGRMMFLDSVIKAYREPILTGVQYTPLKPGPGIRKEIGR